MGTILAGLAIVALTIFAVGGALLVLERGKRVQEAKPTPKRREVEFVTREELEAALEKVAKNLEWEWTEMYEKFEKLHLRLAKRDARAKKQTAVDQEEQDEQQPVLDIRKYRRL